MLDIYFDLVNNYSFELSIEYHTHSVYRTVFVAIIYFFLEKFTHYGVQTIDSSLVDRKLTIFFFFSSRFTSFRNMSNQISRIRVTTKNFATRANFFLSMLFLVSLYAFVSSLLNKKSIVLPALQTSNVIYQFSCHCNSRYEGRTSRRLQDRIKQHVPKSIRSRSSSHKRYFLPVSANLPPSLLLLIQPLDFILYKNSCLCSTL